MATSIKVMSWNIQNLGEALLGVENPDKPNPPDIKRPFIKVMCKVLLNWNPDIVGVMELRGGVGVSVGQSICDRLNPAAMSYTWKYSVSSKQNSARQEETLFLWKDEAGVIQQNPDTLPGPFSLISMIDRQGFTNLFTKLGLTTNDQEIDLLNTLANKDNKLLQLLSSPSSSSNPVYRIFPNQWQQLNMMLKTGGTVTLNLSGASTPAVKNLTQAQQQQVVQTLVAQDMMTFPDQSERTPYVADFLIGPTAAPIRIALLHTPGPGVKANQTSNIPGFAAQAAVTTANTDLVSSTGGMLSVASAPNMLYMGDLNVSQKVIDQQTTVANFGRVTAGSSKTLKFGPNGTSSAVFSQLTTAPMSAVMQLDKVDTSLTTNVLDNSTSTIQQAGANPYDNFYYRVSSAAATAINIGSPSVVQVLLAITPGPQGDPRAGTPASPTYVPDLGSSVLAFFKFRKGNSALANAQTLINVQGMFNQSALQQAQTNATTANTNANNNPGGNANASTSKRKRSSGKTLGKRQKKAKSIAQSGTNIQLTVANIANTNVTTPRGLGDALLYYRKAVSDHLPIIATFTI